MLLTDLSLSVWNFFPDKNIEEKENTSHLVNHVDSVAHRLLTFKRIQKSFMMYKNVYWKTNVAVILTLQFFLYLRLRV